MAKKTTLKAISLGYRPVGSQSSVAYTPLMGVLKGLTIGQDEPDSTEIEAEFFDAPFDILYEGNPVTFNFELANYDLSELPAISIQQTMYMRLRQVHSPQSTNGNLHSSVVTTHLLSTRV